jgi:hypothetical protein
MKGSSPGGLDPLSSKQKKDASHTFATVRQGAQRVGKCAAAAAMVVAEMKIQGEFYGFFLIRGSCVVICYILIMERGNETDELAHQYRFVLFAERREEEQKPCLRMK